MASVPFIYNPIGDKKGPKPGQLFKVVLEEWTCTWNNIDTMRDYMMGVFDRWGPERKMIFMKVGMNLIGESTTCVGLMGTRFEPITLRDYLEFSQFLMASGLVYNIKKKQIISNKSKTVLYSWM